MLKDTSRVFILFFFFIKIIHLQDTLKKRSLKGLKGLEGLEGLEGIP